MYRMEQNALKIEDESKEIDNCKNTNNLNNICIVLFTIFHERDENNSKENESQLRVWTCPKAA